MPEFLGYPLACSSEGKTTWLWEGRGGLGAVALGWGQGGFILGGSWGPSAPGRGGSVVLGMCRVREGWPGLILVVFGEELG